MADSDEPTNWYYYRSRDDRRAELPASPPWRTHATPPVVYAIRDAEPDDTFQPHDNDVRMVNVAIHLRRPLLVTGRPGSGKSSLARSVAHDLALGEVLVWPINSRSTLLDGLYKYDALARLQDASKPGAAPKSIGNYLKLGPLGTALIPRERPRVVLVDEIDKSDIDLPNDLLHVFERGRFEIPELEREDAAKRTVRPADSEHELPVPAGAIQCREFPIVILTSNNERDFSPAFLRRCLRLDMGEPDAARLGRIVAAHFKLARGVDPTWDANVELVVKRFLDLRDVKRELVATDQLLNALHLIKNDGAVIPADGKLESSPVIEAVLRGLTSKSAG